MGSGEEVSRGQREAFLHEWLLEGQRWGAGIRGCCSILG